MGIPDYTRSTGPGEPFDFLDDRELRVELCEPDEREEEPGLEGRLTKLVAVPKSAGETVRDDLSDTETNSGASFPSTAVWFSADGSSFTSDKRRSDNSISVPPGSPAAVDATAPPLKRGVRTGEARSLGGDAPVLPEPTGFARGPPGPALASDMSGLAARRIGVVARGRELAVRSRIGVGRRLRGVSAPRSLGGGFFAFPAPSQRFLLAAYVTFRFFS